MIDTAMIDTPTNRDERWVRAIYELAGMRRPSASEGERIAAESIAGHLRELGCAAAVEQGRAHGGYWWPIGLANGVAAIAGLAALRGLRPRAQAAGGLRPRARLGTAIAAGAAAAGLWDDLGQGRRWMRRLLPRRPTYNVVARAGDPDAERTIVVVAHHDAAHSGLVFHPALGQLGPKLAPEHHERAKQTAPIMFAVWLGPVMIGAGAVAGAARLLRAGLALSLGSIAVMADIGSRSVVPGANDNLSAVGALIALAQRLRDEPLAGARVLLVSTGSEESFSEGMSEFLARHGDELDPSRTELLCLECLGGARLVVVEGEGMLRMRNYPAAMCDALADAAARAAVPVERGAKTVAATDALVALRAGYPVVTLASMEDTKLPLNYHWPNDVADNLRWPTLERAIEVCEQFVRMRAAADPPAA
jgi:acetylornithine deacetylase/succinyl-diaminopimelate desuccinylase-like protein